MDAEQLNPREMPFQQEEEQTASVYRTEEDMMDVELQKDTTVPSISDDTTEIEEESVIRRKRPIRFTTDQDYSDAKRLNVATDASTDASTDPGTDVMDIETVSEISNSSLSNQQGTRSLEEPVQTSVIEKLPDRVIVKWLTFS